MAADQLYKVAYDEAVRTLSEQQAAIDSFRSRAGLLLSSACIATSFLGAQALEGGNLSSLSWLALCGFIAVASASLAILWPRKWEFTANPLGVIEGCIEPAELIRVEELHRALSLQMHNSYLENHHGLKRLAVLFQIATGFVVIEVVLWIAAIASSPSL